ncbi:MAG TPA: hypothetical protein VLC55_07870 [Burkholderiales bacterium]|nr:hypothetical protein [Burkholderiales bacterium]
MTKRHLTLLAGLLATAATFGMPGASYADLTSELHRSDGYSPADVQRAGEPSVVAPSTPAQMAQLANFERQRSLSDGYSGSDWDKAQSPELQTMMAKMANDPRIDALLAYFEAQRRSSDGRG